MSSPTFYTWKRMIRDGQPNAVSDERLVKLVESGLWDAVVDAPDYRALAATLKGGAPLLATPALPASQPAPKWRNENGTIRFSVTSNGVTGEEWIARLKAKGINVSPYAESVLRSDDFESTNGVTYDVAVLPGTLWSSDNVRTTKNIRAEAKKRKFTKLPAEVACLIRESFTDEELAAMGLWWIVVMHAPIDDSDGPPSLLGVYRNGGGRRLSACYDRPGHTWSRDGGFAFAVPAK